MAQMPHKQPIKDSYQLYLKQYFEKHIKEIVDVIKFKGGWEKWLQIELARTINAEYHQPVLCEQSIWTANRIDLWAYPSKGEEPGIPNIGIELKCRTYLEEGIEFANRFHADLVKTAIRPVDKYTPCILYAIGIGHKADVETLYNNVRDPNNEQSIPIYYDEVMAGFYFIYAWVEHNHA